MSRHDAAVLTLRAFAPYAWFQALEFFADGAMSILLGICFRMQGRFSFGGALVSFGPSVLFILVGAFLFFRSRELASWLLPPPANGAVEPLAPHPLPVASVAFAVVGAAVFLYAAPRAIGDGIILSRIDAPGEREERLITEAPRIIANGIQIVLGFLLFLKARVFATVWWRKQQLKPGE